MRIQRLAWYRRIGAKIFFVVSALVVFSLGTFILFAIHNETRQVVGEVIRSVRLLSDTIKLSTRRDMLHYSPERLHQMVDTIGTHPSLNKVRIFNSLGRIIYSSKKSEMGRMVDKRAEQCYACHAAEKPLESLSIPKRVRIYSDTSGQRILAIINPIYNERDCFTAACHVHPATKKVLGVLDIDVSLGELDRTLKTAKLKMVGMGLFTIIVLAVSIFFLTQRCLNRPLQELIDGTNRVAQGDLDSTVAVHSKDELGLFADSFNRMTQDLKRAKQELTHWAERLEERVKERTRQLESAHEQLIHSEKLASLGKLAAGVAHEINNPLTGILTFSQLLADEFPEGSQTRKDLETIVRETIRCRTIVRGLLEFSRQTATEKRPIDINRLLDEVLALLVNQELFHNIRVERRFADHLPSVPADENQLKQVFFNILVNAAEATGSQGLIEVTTDLCADRHGVIVTCVDNGCGIPAEQINRLFDPFHTTKENGTGLGLAVSYGIIKAHHGDIGIHSRPGAGTTVTITLPLDEP